MFKLKWPLESITYTSLSYFYIPLKTTKFFFLLKVTKILDNQPIMHKDFSKKNTLRCGKITLKQIYPLPIKAFRIFSSSCMY